MCKQSTLPHALYHFAMKSFSTIIYAYRRIGSDKVMDSMIARGLKPDIVAYNFIYMVVVLLAIELRDDMIRRGLKPNQSLQDYN
ncbi:hypothetical protein OSB04_001271 [Centaurea solstitialis]|uniref:Pentatricopeptide repeat-containing protein n=1 Tax=Centaurea solstitialis TaxID=347529 RepID=A0AA38TQP1_9ASTR|nr:hypothetical protein OSB04_001271 [Centaurea solstitialis]